MFRPPMAPPPPLYLYRKSHVAHLLHEQEMLRREWFDQDMTRLALFVWPSCAIVFGVIIGIAFN